MDSFVEATIQNLRQKIGGGKVLCALSGEVDSSVAAVLLSKAKSTFFVFGERKVTDIAGGFCAGQRMRMVLVLMFCRGGVGRSRTGETYWRRWMRFYRKHGLYLEKLGTLEDEWGGGAKQIARAVESYQKTEA